MKRQRQQMPPQALSQVPYAPEAEVSTLGCVLLNPAEALPVAQAMFRGHQVFYDLRNAVVWAAMLDKAREGATAEIDVITILERIKRLQALAAEAGERPLEVDWVMHVSALPDKVSSAANVEAYVAIVWEKFLLRRMLQVTTEGQLKIQNCTEPVDTVLDRIEAEVLSVNVARGSTEARGMADVTSEVQHRIESMRRGVGMISGIRTHYAHFDKWTAGLHRGELVILAARPSLGKTSLAMGLARNVAVQERIPVGVFSMEMKAADLGLRLLCAERDVDSHKVRTGFPSDEEVARLIEATKVVGLAPMLIDDTPALGIQELRARARRMNSAAQRKWGQPIGLWVVDYLQLMHGSKDYNGNRALEVAEISGGLKAMAREMDGAMVALSQLNREVDRSKYRKPQLADLRESGAIEQDADTVLMLYRPKSNDGEDEDEHAPTRPVNVLIAKQRNGPSDWDVEFIFWKPFTRFEDAYGNRGREMPGMEKHEGKQDRGPLPSNEEMGLKQ